MASGEIEPTTFVPKQLKPTELWSIHIIAVKYNYEQFLLSVLFSIFVLQAIFSAEIFSFTKFCLLVKIYKVPLTLYYLSKVAILSNTLFWEEFNIFIITHSIWCKKLLKMFFFVPYLATFFFFLFIYEPEWGTLINTISI